MARKVGYDARVRIGVFSSTTSLGTMVNYAVRRWVWDESSPGQDTTNSEGIPAMGDDSTNSPAAVGYAATARNIRRVRVTLEQATFDDQANQNPWASPLVITAGKYIRVEIYPDRSASTYHFVRTLYVERVNPSGDVNGLQPITLEGVSDGVFEYYRTGTAPA